MSFYRISDIPELEVEEHYTFLVKDKLWLFPKKFHNQPTFHAGQRVTHKGGYSLYFDIKTSKWSDVEHFNPLTTEEHVDELLFVHENQICCLLFSNLGKIEFLQLAVFDFNERQFTMWNEFNNISISAKNEDSTFKQYLILANGNLPDKSRLLIASIEGDLHLFKLSIDFSSKQATITPDAKYSALERESIMLFPIKAAVQNDKAIVEYANRAACTVHWESKKLDKLSIGKNNSSNFERIEIKGEPPKFQFVGTKLTSLLNGGKDWIHFCGNIQKGMTGQEFNGEIWKLENAFSSEPEWKKIDGIEVPKEAQNAVYAFDAEAKILYIVDPKNGLFTAKL